MIMKSKSFKEVPAAEPKRAMPFHTTEDSKQHYAGKAKINFQSLYKLNKTSTLMRTQGSNSFKRKEVSRHPCVSLAQRMGSLFQQKISQQYKSAVLKRKRNRVVKREESLLVNEKSRRTWMKRSGKKLDFTDSELKKMRHYFNQLDTNKMGYIGCKELLQPMISLGIVQNREELERIIFSVDDDGSIHFSEFLNILKIGGEESNALVSFFKDLLRGRVGKLKTQPGMPFNILVDLIRRNKIKDGLYSSIPRIKSQGMGVVKAFRRELQLQNRFYSNTPGLSFMQNYMLQAIGSMP